MHEVRRRLQADPHEPAPVPQVRKEMATISMTSSNPNIIALSSRIKKLEERLDKIEKTLPEPSVMEIIAEKPNPFRQTDIEYDNPTP